MTYALPNASPNASPFDAVLQERLGIVNSINPFQLGILAVKTTPKWNSYVSPFGPLPSPYGPILGADGTPIDIVGDARDALVGVGGAVGDILGAVLGGVAGGVAKPLTLPLIAAAVIGLVILVKK